MGSKKHRKRHNSSSSSDSDSSTDSKKEHSKKTSYENEEYKPKRTNSKYRESGRAAVSSSEEGTSYRNRRSKSRSKDRKNKRSKSRSSDRKYSQKDRSRSRDSRRDPEGEAKSSRDSRHSFRVRSNNNTDYRRNNTYDDRRNDNYYKRQDNASRRRRSRSSSFDHANAKWGRDDDLSKNKKKEEENKAKPNFGLSGKLTEETNTYKGVLIKYSEPPEARKPRRRWRLYPFKGDKALQTLYIHRESAYLIGRDRKVVDLPVDHPSCSKQHAALQYRLVPFTRENGSVGKRVRPYLIDLESANGTFINNKKIDSRKYVELLERDVIKFGFSSREYVLLHENSKDEALDDDVKLEDEEIKVELDIKEEKE